MNGVDHVEPHTAIPDADRRGCRRSPVSARRIRRCPRTSTRSGRPSSATRPALETITGELRGGEDYANLLPGVLSARVYLKQQNAHVQTLLESYAEPLAVVRVACCGAPLSGRRAAPRVEDAAAEPPARQHLRLQHRRRARREHDAVRARAAGRRRGRRRRARRDRRLGARAAAGRRSARVVVNPDAVERAQVVEAFIDLPIDSAEPWRTVDAQALDRPVAFWPRDATIAERHRTATAQRVEFQVLGEEQVVSARDEPLRNAVGAERPPPSCAVVGAGAAAVRLCGVRSAIADRRRTSAAAPRGSVATAGAWSRPANAAAENERLRLAVNDDGTFEVTDKASGVTVSRASRRSRTSATSATSTTTARPQPTAA